MVISKIRLTDIDSVKKFVNIVTQMDTDIDLAAGRFVVDAKSILGIFSIDLSQPIELRIHADQQEGDSILRQLTDYLAPGV